MKLLLLLMKLLLVYQVEEDTGQAKLMQIMLYLVKRHKYQAFSQDQKASKLLTFLEETSSNYSNLILLMTLLREIDFLINKTKLESI
jgi:hypothetical protein